MGKAFTLVFFIVSVLLSWFFCGSVVRLLVCSCSRAVAPIVLTRAHSISFLFCVAARACPYLHCLHCFALLAFLYFAEQNKECAGSSVPALLCKCPYLPLRGTARMCKSSICKAVPCTYLPLRGTQVGESKAKQSTPLYFAQQNKGE